MHTILNFHHPGICLANEYMLDEAKAENVCRLFKSARQFKVSLRRLKITAWMIVRDDDTGSAIGDGIGEDLARVN